MNEYDSPDLPDITSTGAFRDALRDVLRAAGSNDVAIHGMWPLSVPADDERWLVDVTRTD